MKNKYVVLSVVCFGFAVYHAVSPGLVGNGPYAANYIGGTFGGYGRSIFLLITSFVLIIFHYVKNNDQ